MFYFQINWPQDLKADESDRMSCMRVWRFEFIMWDKHTQASSDFCKTAAELIWHKSLDRGKNTWQALAAFGSTQYERSCSYNNADINITKIQIHFEWTLTWLTVCSSPEHHPETWHTSILMFFLNPRGSFYLLLCTWWALLSALLAFYTARWKSTGSV